MTSRVPILLVLLCVGSAGRPAHGGTTPGAQQSEDWWRSVCKHIAAEEYCIAETEPGRTLSTVNRANGFRALFDMDGVQLSQRSSEPAWRWSWRLTAFGRGPAARAVPPVPPRTLHGRAEFPYPGIVEWYENTPQGLEQGFDLAERPPGTGAVRVTAEVRVTGLHATSDRAGTAIRLFDPNGAEVLQYGNLFAVDSQGQGLPARMDVSAVRRLPEADSNTDADTFLVQLTIDDSDAVYPVTIDPLLKSPASNWQTTGGQADAYLGMAVAAGDVNGDGYSDLIVGAPYYDSDTGETDAGRVVIYHGSAAGLAAVPAWTTDGLQAYAYFGIAVAAGDVNGDGYADVIVGATDYDAQHTDEGRVVIYYGSAGGAGTTADWAVHGGQAYAYFGVALTAADSNGDGYDDVAIGAAYYDTDHINEGRVTIYEGTAAGPGTAPDTAISGGQAYAYFGVALTTGNINGDGYADIVAGSAYFDGDHTDAGRVSAYYGSAGGLSTTADWTVHGGQDHAYFGTAVAVGDTDADGYGDVIVGEPYFDNTNTDAGRVALYRGSAAGPAGTASWTVQGDQQYGYLGVSVGAVPNLNGDPFADVIIGASHYDANTTDGGRVVAYHGAASGPTGTPAWHAEGRQAYSYLGAKVAAVGDINGDGVGDVCVAATYHDGDDMNEGAVFVSFGSQTTLPDAPDWTAGGYQENAYFGAAAAGAGDVNGDGFADVIVGAPYYDNGETDEGAAFVFLGAAGGLSTVAAWKAESDQAEAHLGAAVAGAGDVNGDGFADVIVSANTYDGVWEDQGYVFVYHGSADGLSATPDWTSYDNQAEAYFGARVATAGDVNADGYSDVLVAASFHDNGQIDEGRVYLFLGSANGLSVGAPWTAESNQYYAYFGASIAGVGDVNGDGRDDVVVGAPYAENGQTDEGQAFLYLGTSSGLAATPAWTGEGGQDTAYFGAAVAGAGDVNGDGYADVTVGASYFDNGETDEGRAFLFLGSAQGLPATPAWTAESDQAEAYFGVSVAGVGDLNADGYDDVAVAATLFDAGETDEGRVAIYLGSAAGLSAAPDRTYDGEQEYAYLGTAVTGPGDLDGDGADDLVVGASGYGSLYLDEGALFAYYGTRGGLPAETGWSATGTQAYAYLGTAVCHAGDVNADGHDDVIVGAPYLDVANTNEGAAFLFLGSAEGLAQTPAWTAEGGQESATLGSALAAAGDVNADGYDDVIIGVPGYDAGETDAAGRALLFLGSATGLADTHAWSTQGGQQEESLGTAVAAAGDVNGDGYDDVLVGASAFDGNHTDEGAVLLFLGSADSTPLQHAWTVTGGQTEAYLGAAMAAGDVNGDGYTDILAGASGFGGDHASEGAVLLFLGSADSTPLQHAWTVTGGQAEARLGAAVTAADVNGDGYSDILAGAYAYDSEYTDEGRVLLFLGSAAGPADTAAWTADGAQQAAYFGTALARAGDVNADGYDDVIVAGTGFDITTPDEGMALLYLGSPAGLITTPAWWTAGGQDYAYLGGAVASAGDVDGDGCDDVLIGAAYANARYPDQGRVILRLGDTDMDGDGARDSWEQQHELDPTDSTDALADPDTDNVTSIWEQWIGTDPNSADTDGDGVDDRLEPAHGTDPNNADETPAAFCVSSAGAGSDATGYGTQAAPWASIQHALDSVTGSADHPLAILVAAGTYREAVTMHSHEYLYGGYAPADWTRDLAANLSVLDGATARNGAPAYHVVTAADNSGMDGFTIAGGRADGSSDQDRRGGGVYGTADAFGVSRCTIANNAAAERGGGIYAAGSNWVVSNCVIAGNSAQTGGGVAFYGGALPYLINCTVTGNVATNGGGASADGVGPTILNCVFWDNTDDLHGCSATYSCVEDGDAGTGNTSRAPRFVDGRSGALTAAPAYDSDAGQTTVTDADAAWQQDALAGRLIQFAGTQPLLFPVATNTTTTVTVWGNLSAQIQQGTNYSIRDPNLADGSPCVDAGFGDLGESGQLVADADRNGNPRTDDTQLPNRGSGTPQTVDMGAYERQTDSTVATPHSNHPYDPDGNWLIDDTELAAMKDHWRTAQLPYTEQDFFMLLGIDLWQAGAYHFDDTASGYRTWGAGR